ncbi:MAG: DNA starvation/stationary phase protection protein [Vulcanimicrobiaceae bacterium]
MPNLLKSRVPKQLATPNNLGPEAAEKIAAAINPLVADAFALYLKTKNFHWHMSGSHYREYHLLLDEHATQIFAMTDVLAERVRKVGGTTIRSIGDVSRLQNVKDDDNAYVAPLDMLTELMNDENAFASRQRAAHEVVDDCKDVATASLLENFIDETERRTWFLYETIVGADHTA